MATKQGDVQVIREGLTFKRYFTQDGVHPFDQVEWEQRDAVIPNYKEGGNAFEQRDVEFPVTWSQNATNIVAQKYFRGTLGTPERESSVRQLVGRVVDTITGWGRATRGAPGVGSPYLGARRGLSTTSREIWSQPLTDL